MRPLPGEFILGPHPFLLPKRSSNTSLAPLPGSAGSRMSDPPPPGESGHSTAPSPETGGQSLSAKEFPLCGDIEKPRVVPHCTHRAKFCGYTRARGADTRVAIGDRCPGRCEGWAWGTWLTFHPAGTWGLGLHVSLVWNLVWESDKERPSSGPFQDVAICLPPCGLSLGI